MHERIRDKSAKEHAKIIASTLPQHTNASKSQEW